MASAIMSADVFNGVVRDVRVHARSRRPRSPARRVVIRANDGGFSDGGVGRAPTRALCSRDRRCPDTFITSSTRPSSQMTLMVVPRRPVEVDLSHRDQYCSTRSLSPQMPRSMATHGLSRIG